MDCEYSFDKNKILLKKMFIKLDIVFSDFVCYTDTRLQKIRKNVKIARHNYDSNSISRYSMIMSGDIHLRFSDSFSI